MDKSFLEIKLFQVKPDKTEEFEVLAEEMVKAQFHQKGCINAHYFKRFYTIDGVELGKPPRQLAKIVKCVKYYGIWEFDTKENYGLATKWFFDQYLKLLARLLVAPFDINCGYSL